jgi:large-conductance mechanosensitive channel
MPSFSLEWLFRQALALILKAVDLIVNSGLGWAMHKFFQFSPLPDIIDFLILWTLIFIMVRRILRPIAKKDPDE